MKQKAARILVLLAVTLFSAFAYTFLHESGHALVSLLAGGKITAFSINFWQLSAHVGTHASLTPAQTILNNLAGASLPLLVWLVFMLVIPRRSNAVLEMLKLTSSLMFLSTLLAWIAIPLLKIIGQAPASDDVINFIRNSGLPPISVSISALVLFTGGVLFAANRLGGLKSAIDALRSTDIDFASPKIRTSLLAILGIAILIGFTSFALNGFRFSAPRASFSPPVGSRFIQTIDLAKSAYDQTVLCDFTLVEPTPVGIYLIVENINTDYIDIRLTGPQGYDTVVLHGEAYATPVDYPRLETTLQPGRYTCLLTSQPSKGKISLYINGLP